MHSYYSSFGSLQCGGWRDGVSMLHLRVVIPCVTAGLYKQCRHICCRTCCVYVGMAQFPVSPNQDTSKKNGNLAQYPRYGMSAKHYSGYCWVLEVYLLGFLVPLYRTLHASLISGPATMITVCVLCVPFSCSSSSAQHAPQQVSSASASWINAQRALATQTRNKFEAMKLRLCDENTSTNGNRQRSAPAQQCS